MLKLYHYEICPYCIRVRMMLEACGFDYTMQILQYDDKQTTQRLAQTNLTPILTLENGTSISESMDIIQFLIKKSKFNISEKRLPKEISSTLGKVKAIRSKLFKPRFLSLNLKELETDSAKAYFLNRWNMNEEMINHELQQTPSYIRKLYPHLETISKKLLSENFVYNQWAIADIELFPSLRSLTCVKGLVFPERLSQYISFHLKQAKIVPLKQV